MKMQYEEAMSMEPSLKELHVLQFFAQIQFQMIEAFKMSGLDLTELAGKLGVEVPVAYAMMAEPSKLTMRKVGEFFYACDITDIHINMSKG